MFTLQYFVDIWPKTIAPSRYTQNKSKMQNNVSQLNVRAMSGQLKETKLGLKPSSINCFLKEWDTSASEKDDILVQKPPTACWIQRCMWFSILLWKSATWRKTIKEGHVSTVNIEHEILRLKSTFNKAPLNIIFTICIFIWLWLSSFLFSSHNISSWQLSLHSSISCWKGFWDGKQHESATCLCSPESLLYAGLLQKECGKQSREGIVKHGNKLPRGGEYSGPGHI